MSAVYNSVSSVDTSFGNPRQKTWVVFHQCPIWTLKLTTTAFPEAQDMAKTILSEGGTFSGIDRIAVAEIVPIDIVMTPSV